MFYTQLNTTNVCNIVILYYDYFIFYVVRSIPLGIGLAVGTGVTMATIKYSHNSYFPPLPSQRATIQAPEAWK